MLDPSSAFVRSWTVEPTVAFGVALVAGLYAAGWRRMWRRLGPRSLVGRGRAVAFAVGLGMLCLALMSPVAAFSGLLFSMHMTQHMLVTMIAAPLLLIGAPSLPLLWALPLGWRRAVGRVFAPGSVLHAVVRWLTHPIAALGLHTLAVWYWHLPTLYEASLENGLIHELQHITFLATALLFWWPVVQPPPQRRRLQPWMVLLYLTGATISLMKIVGGVFTFAGEAVYPHYAQVPRVWGLPVVADQQIAGVIMWGGGFVVLGVAFTVVFFRWAQEAERAEPHGARQAAGLPPLTPAPGTGVGRTPLRASDQPVMETVAITQDGHREASVPHLARNSHRSAEPIPPIHSE